MAFFAGHRLHINAVRRVLDVDELAHAHVVSAPRHRSARELIAASMALGRLWNRFDRTQPEGALRVKSNPQRIHRYNSVNLRKGYPMIEIRTPREVLSAG